MRAARLALCLTVTASLAASAGVGQAATKKKPAPRPKPVCNLVVDDKGDGVGVVGNDAGLDVLSADLASSASRVTAVFRLAGAPLEFGSPNAPLGANYYFTFTVPGAEFPVFLSAAADAGSGFTYRLGTLEPSANGQTYTTQAGEVTGAVTGSTLTLSADRAVLSSYADVKPGASITDLNVLVTVPVGVPGVASLLETADEAAATKPYTAGAPSCVKP